MLRVISLVGLALMIGVFSMLMAQTSSLPSDPPRNTNRSLNLISFDSPRAIRLLLRTISFKSDWRQGLITITGQGLQS